MGSSSPTSSPNWGDHCKDASSRRSRHNICRRPAFIVPRYGSQISMPDTVGASICDGVSELPVFVARAADIRPSFLPRYSVDSSPSRK